MFAWLRKAPGGDPVVVISNMTPVPRDDYRVPMPLAGQLARSASTPMPAGMAASNTGNQGEVVADAGDGTAWPADAELYLPPLATLILKYDPD